jgi:hypothetical protein
MNVPKSARAWQAAGARHGSVAGLQAVQRRAIESALVIRHETGRQ